MKIAQEPFSTVLFEEILPLAQRSWNESTVIKADTCAFYGERDFDIQPDAEQYQRVHDLGLLLIVTLRDEGELVGYMIAVIHRSWHHKHILTSTVDCAYIEPDYRTKSKAAMEFFEKTLAERGAQIIGWPTHVDGPLYKVLKSRGYVPDDVVMEKRLCASRQQ